MLTDTCLQKDWAFYISKAMLWPSQKVYTIDIPKTGCKTKWAVGDLMNADPDMPNGQRFKGHWKLSRAQFYLRQKNIDISEFEFWTVIRDPIKRATSALNYHYANRNRNLPEMSLEEFIMFIRTGGSKDNLFYSQQSFLDVPHSTVKLWPMEKLGEMLRELGWTYDVPHNNRSTKIWSEEDFRKSPKFDYMMEIYHSDWDLYNKALKNFE